MSNQETEDQTRAIALFAANLFRVARGGGRAWDLFTDFMAIGAGLAAASGYNEKAKAVDTVTNGLSLWSRLRHEQLLSVRKNCADPDFEIARHEFETDICDAALMMIASQIEGNGTQLSRSQSAIWSALGRYKDAMRSRDREIEDRQLKQMMAERIKSQHSEARVSNANNRLMNAANDNEIESYVYFITDGEAIKIGKANNPKSRLSSLQTSHYKPLRILGLLPGAEDVERELHRRFTAQRLKGEWFKDCKEIRTFINRHNIAKTALNDNSNPSSNAA